MYICINYKYIPIDSSVYHGNTLRFRKPGEIFIKCSLRCYCQALGDIDLI